MMSGLLQSQGTLVQRKKLRESSSRVSAIPVAQRLARTIQRRKYSVPMSNSLWHIDGHMKLIRWGISTHGGIDGYSRVITFLHADTDNKSSTVLRLFVNACKEHGVPSRVRSDYGGENVAVALFINLLNGESRYSHITGRSVHNQRIERLWRDVYTQVVSKFYQEFYCMEDRGILDHDNDGHKYALRLVYLPIINKDLTLFKEGWNSHKLSTEHQKTPYQLWLNGILNKINSTLTPIQNIYEHSLPDHFNTQLRQYGINPDNSTDQPEVTSPSIISSEQESEMISRFTDDHTPEQKFVKCLEYLTELDII